MYSIDDLYLRVDRNDVYDTLKCEAKSVAPLPTESESVYTLHRSKQSTRLREPALKPAKRPLLLVKCTNYSSNLKYDV